MYVLYHFPFSQHARRVVALMEAAGLRYELRHVALDKGEHLSPAFLEINPNHQVPSLIDGTAKIHESNAILRYLCVKHRLHDWYPDDLPARAAVEQWLDWCQCRFGPAVTDVVLNTVFMGKDGDAAAIARGHDRLAEAGPILEAGLDFRDYVAGGSHPTIADLALAANMSHLELAGAVPDLPNIRAWLARMYALPAFAATLPQARAA